MADKGLVDRDEGQRPQIYRPRLTEQQTQSQLVDDLLNRAFGGSARRLVMQALSRRASPQDMAEIQRLLDKLDGG
jgi:predicted transcriptional regulator